MPPAVAAQNVPATTCPAMTDVEVAAVAARLRTAQPAWEKLSVSERAAWVGRLRDWLLDHEAEVLATLSRETGKPRSQADVEFGMSLDLVNYYADRADKFLREDSPRPHGLVTLTRRLRVSHRPFPLVGVMVPWNFPLGLGLFDAVPALLAGCAVLMKPSEMTPDSLGLVQRGWQEIGAPPVLGVVTGFAATGEAVVDQVDYVQFTGSTRTGRLVAARAAARLVPYGLELGGKDPAVVLADADPKRAAAGIVFGALANTGQMCTSIERVYVVEEIYDQFLSALLEVIDGVRQSDDPTAVADIGVMTTLAQADLVRAQLADAVAKGATIVRGGPGDGRVVPATVLTDVDHSMTVMTEETFGPVIPVMRVASEDEAVRLANDSPYGLSASLWSGDFGHAEQVASRLEAGAIDINDASVHLACFPVPQSGWKESGVGGRLGGAYGILKFTRPQTVVSQRVDVPLLESLVWFPVTPAAMQVTRRLLRGINGRDMKRRLGWKV